MNGMNKRMAKLALVLTLGGIAGMPGAAWAHDYGVNGRGDCDEPAPVMEVTAGESASEPVAFEVAHI